MQSLKPYIIMCKVLQINRVDSPVEYRIRRPGCYMFTEHWLTEEQISIKNLINLSW
jgi:hypothetical protein